MEDFLLLDELLNDEEKIIRETTHRFVDKHVTPLMAEAYERGKFPKQIIHECAELGFFGLTLPEEYGCASTGYIAYGLVCQELERGDSALRSLVSVQSSLCMYPIFRFGSNEQKNKYLPKMAKGELIGCFGLTESEAGSDPVSMKTNAKKVSGGWVLNGSKMWITNATISDLAIVWAKTEGDVRGFILEKETAGFERNEIKHKMSLRVSPTGELVFKDCFVPDDNQLPGSEEGLSAPLTCLTQARYGIAWGVIGAAMACYDITLQYAKERIQFSKPIASFQLIQKDLADMFTEIVKAQLLNYRIGRLIEQDKVNHVMVSMAKMNACREALNIARRCRDLLGANGIMLEYNVIRHMMNLESVITYEGTDTIHHLILGRHITGISAFE